MTSPILNQSTVASVPQVRNIVSGSRDALERLYAQRFACGPVAEAAGLAPQQPQSWQQASCEASRAALLLQLPMVGATPVVLLSIALNRCRQKSHGAAGALTPAWHANRGLCGTERIDCPKSVSCRHLLHDWRWETGVMHV